MSESGDRKYQPETLQTAQDQTPETIISPDTRRSCRIPPGQSRTRKWPVLDATGTPNFSPQQWQLKVFGLVDHPLTFRLEQFQSLPRVHVFSDFHCVTRWSRLGNLWEGVSSRDLLEQAGVQAAAKFVILHGLDQGWTTNLPLPDFLENDVLLADRHDGEPISADHGGPVRAIVPRLYAWKSAKWLTGIQLTDVDQPGYWEQAGYHLRGDPWIESETCPDGQRFRDDSLWTSGD